MKTPEKICSICQTKFHLHDNQSGLVFGDKLFVCETCCDSHSEDELMDWTKTIMQTPEGGMPIALWLIHEQNKDKLMFSKRK